MYEPPGGSVPTSNDTKNMVFFANFCTFGLFYTTGPQIEEKIDLDFIFRIHDLVRLNVKVLFGTRK